MDEMFERYINNRKNGHGITVSAIMAPTTLQVIVVFGLIGLVIGLAT